MKNPKVLFGAVNWDILLKEVDNGTTYVTVPTPKGWKCKRKGCHSDFKHTHTTYDALRSTLNSRLDK